VQLAGVKQTSQESHEVVHWRTFVVATIVPIAQTG
jgi:hypothetical protein